MSKDRNSKYPFILLTAFFLLACSSTSAQEQTEPPAGRCPSIYVDCPSGLSETPSFKATVEGLAPDQQVTYAWTVVGGEIIGGQGTREILIRRDPAEGNSLTAVVTVGGIPDECTGKASCTTISCPAPRAQRFDAYRPLTLAAERKRLNALALDVIGNSILAIKTLIN